MPYDGTLSAMCISEIIRKRLPINLREVPTELQDKLLKFRDAPNEWGILSDDCFWYDYNRVALSKNLDDVMVQAAGNGHTEIVKDCLRKGAKNWRGSSYRACKYGRVEILKAIFANPLARDELANISLILGASYGHPEIVKMCYREDMEDALLEWAMNEAASGGHEDIVRMCYEWGVKDVSQAMLLASGGGHENVVRVLREEFGAGNLDEAMAYAAEGGREDVVRMLHEEFGASNINWALVEAVKGGYRNIVRMCLKWGATEIRRALGWAIFPRNTKEIIKILYEQGDPEITRAVSLYSKGDLSGVESLYRWWKTEDEHLAQELDFRFLECSKLLDAFKGMVEYSESGKMKT